MVELHGWITIRENYIACDEDSDIEQIVTYLVQIIEKMGIDKTLLPIHFQNGEASVSATKFANHFSEDVKQIIAFFRCMYCQKEILHCTRTHSFHHIFR